MYGLDIGAMTRFCVPPVVIALPSMYSRPPTFIRLGSSIQAELSCPL
ncbi:hypothetical protein QF034_002423 [Streptomyces africanus]|uniref:Uncharacterized protein n=1 Tax=Streptomyces africanus TaxID=231024 RepID=A0ABU0QLC6_9ACTN|nr:hypothetical protein [Streptomyces africanus]